MSGLANISLPTTFIAFFVYYVFVVISQWKIYEKAGRKGWVSLIPIYRYYVLYKVTWKASAFWVLFATDFVGFLMSSLSTNDILTGTIPKVITGIVSLVAIVLHIIQSVKMSKAFGHGGGFAVGLIFLAPIFWLILGFGSSTYQKSED